MENILVVALLLQMATFVASINRTGTIQRDLPDCINNDDYFFFNGKGVTCLWVDMNRREYCEKHLFRIKCPKTCGACNGKESNYYSGMKKDKSGNIYQTCQWLMNHSSNERRKLCGSMGQLCPGICNDKNTQGIKREEISLSNTNEKFTANVMQQHRVLNIFESEQVSAIEPSYSFNIFNSPLSSGDKIQSRIQCSDDTEFFFQLSYSKRWRKCSWLTRNSKKRVKRQNNYCLKSDIASACPLSCRLCDVSDTQAPSKTVSTTPSVSPSKTQNTLQCKDNESFLFALDDSRYLRKCAWLTKKNEEERINKYCNRGHIKGACPLTCDSCSFCQDDDSFSFFRNNGIKAKCEWLANDISGTAPKRQAKYCNDNKIGSRCMFSCGFCIGTTFSRDNYIEESSVPSFTISPTQNPSTLHSGIPSLEPSETRSHGPSSIPSSKPSGYLSLEPSSNPSLSLVPSSDPSLGPSEGPTSIPSSLPSSIPSYNPSFLPSFSPSSLPSELPSASPSTFPSDQPSESNAPSLSPAPTTRNMPSVQPSLSSKPSTLPTLVPSVSQSGFPSLTYSKSPSVSPSDLPSLSPSMQPSDQPTSVPSSMPSLGSSQRPSDSPSSYPSLSPSTSYSPSLSNAPSQQSESPSNKPSTTMNPSEEPSNHPSLQPSNQPSNMFSMEPSSEPSIFPSSGPSSIPSFAASLTPSNNPSLKPSLLPSSSPSNEPSSDPSDRPSMLPSVEPSMVPSIIPSFQPSSLPSKEPSRSPSGMPSQFPSSLPSTLPSEIPSAAPSRFFSSTPSATVTKASTPAPKLTKEPVPTIITKEPATKQPATKQPVTKVPATKVPATKVPATKVPATKVPAPTVVTKQPILTKQPS